MIRALLRQVMPVKEMRHLPKDRHRLKLNLIYLIRVKVSLP